MKRTRYSLYYLAGYLLFGGIGFLFLPQQMLKLFLSTGNYSDVMVRIVGVLLLALGMVIVQIIRMKLEVLYKTTLVVRTVILISLFSFYFVYRDPLLIVLTCIVGLGFILTLSSYLVDKQKAP